MFILNHKCQVSFDSCDVHSDVRTITCDQNSVPPTETPPMAVTPDDLQHRGASRILHRLSGLHPPKWPNPEESIGRFYRRLGRLSCWEAKGPALSTFLEIATKIRKHLECLGDTVTGTIVWCVFMVGKSERTAMPTVFFCSRDARARQHIRNRIDKSGILKAYPGFKTGDASCPPDFDQLKQLATGKTRSPQAKRSNYLNCGNAIGRSISITQVKAGKIQSVACATIGAVFQLQDDLLFATAAHPFRPEGLSLDLGIDDSSDFEYDVDDEDYYPSDVEELLAASATMTIKSSMTVPPESEQTEMGEGDTEEVEDESEHNSFQDPKWSCTYGVGDIAFFSNPALDFCLLPLKEDNSKSFMDLSVRGETNGAYCLHIVPPICAVGHGSAGPVVAYTGSKGVQTGILSGTRSFITLAGARETQELWLVQLSGKLYDGDCGSLVVNALTSELEGHIIAGSPDTGMAYIVPARDMLKHIQTSSFPKQCRLAVWNESCRAAQSAIRTNSVILVEPQQHSVNQTLPQALETGLRRILSLKRREALLMQISNGSINRKLSNIPVYPRPPSTASSQRFRNVLNSLSEVPLQWENPALLDNALLIVPTKLIHEEAQKEYERFTKQSQVSGQKKMITWGQQDCVLRALLRWFKSDFFSWVDKPVCSVCGGPTISKGIVLPQWEEAARGANQVELYRCRRASCGADERFPRYTDVLTLLSTRRGRIIEWALCFTMLCRALGARVRLVWNAEEGIWTEVYSQYRMRWIHVDAREGRWNQPLLYTEVRKKKMSYCIAFSVDGPTDVTRRYVRSSTYALPRDQAPEAELFYILDEIRNERRADLGTQERARLKQETREEEKGLRAYIAQTVADEFCRIRLQNTRMEERLSIEEIIRNFKLSSHLCAKTERLGGKTERLRGRHAVI